MRDLLLEVPAMSCRWEILEQILRLIQSCETLEDYKRLVSQGRHILDVLPGGVLRPGNGIPGLANMSISPAAEHPPQGSSLPRPTPSSQAVGNSSGAGVLSLREDGVVQKLKNTD